MPLAVTMGEPAGIGVELIGMAWQARTHRGLAPFYCHGDDEFIAARFAACGMDVPVEEISAPHEALARFNEGLPVVPLSRSVRSGYAQAPAVDDAASVVQSIERAVDDVIDGKAGAVITAPVQKETLYAAGFAFPGHTEFLGELARRRGLDARPVMMLACDELRVVPVTIHVPLRNVPVLLTVDAIVETAEIVARDLIGRLRIPSPRLAVTGLNPHAGEGGHIGSEDRDIIAPAIDVLRSRGLAATGPHPGDTLFHPAARAGYDAAICMYHDQALIPIKTIAFDESVNVTLGLPFVRTSPDHGTALMLAGTGTANPSSFIAALHMADRMTAPAA